MVSSLMHSNFCFNLCLKTAVKVSKSHSKLWGPYRSFLKLALVSVLFFAFEMLSSPSVALTSATPPCRRPGFPALLPRGAAQPAAEGGDRPSGGLTGLHQRLAGRPALPPREGEEEPRGRRHPVRYRVALPTPPTRLQQTRDQPVRDECK